MTSDSRLMLLDTASMYFRAFFGVPDSFRSPDGKPVNAIRGLLDFIARLHACWTVKLLNAPTGLRARLASTG